jgi:DNA-directed RNA polymerase beta subunit
LRDKEGNVIEEKKLTLMKVPYLTERGTFIRGGNEYVTVNQLRLLPGPFTRRQQNGILETQFNVRQGTGSNFQVAMLPETSEFRLWVKGSDLHLYSLLKDMGVSDDELKERWGEEIFQKNSLRYDKRVLDKAYEKLVPKWARPNVNRPLSVDEKRDAIRSALNGYQVHKSIAERNLPPLVRRALENRNQKTASVHVSPVLRNTLLGKKLASTVDFSVDKSEEEKQKERISPQAMIRTQDDGEEYVPIGFDSVLDATDRILQVSRGEVKPDDRDHYANKKVFTPAALLRERIRIDADHTRRKLARFVANTKSLKVLTPGIFNAYAEGLLSGNPLSSPIEEINPISLIEQSRRLTHFGPGGINSEDAITESMQSVHPSQFGFISAIEGPESSRAGVDVRAAIGAKIGSDGRIYQKFRRKDGSEVWLNPQQLMTMVVKLPD